MKSVKIYLAGQCKGLPDYGKEWRKTATTILNTIAEEIGVDIDVFDPTEYFEYGGNASPRMIKEYYLNRLKQCDLVLLNGNGTEYSIGTAQEVQFAVDHHIPVIGFGTENTYNWITDVDCMAMFSSVHVALDFIRDYYMMG